MSGPVQTASVTQATREAFDWHDRLLLNLAGTHTRMHRAHRAHRRTFNHIRRACVRGAQGVRVGNLGVLAFCFVMVQLAAMAAMLLLLLRARREVAGSAKASQAASFLVLPVFLRILMAYAAVELLSAVVSLAVPIRVSMLNYESGAPAVPLTYG